MIQETLRRGAFALLGIALVVPASASAQRSLGAPESVFPEDFGTIQTVRELPDGRILIADPLGKELYTVDMASGRRQVVGRQGQGPQEYLQPDAVWAMPGDSTLLVDLGNGRVVMLGPDLTFGRTSPIAVTNPGEGPTLVLALPQGVDGRGRVYTRALGGGMDGTLPDSAAVIRVDMGTRAVDTVATFKLPDRTQTHSGGPNNRSTSVTNVPLSAEDAWGVAGDGWLAVVRSGDYHLEWIRPDGSVVRGAPVPFRPISIGTAEKEEWMAEVGRSGGGIGIGIEMNNGRATMTFARGGGGGGPDEIDRLPWPDAKPAFYSGRVPVDPNGNAWVRRHTRAGENSTYDIFDRSGNRVDTVTLDHGKRVVGFGDTWVYVVAFDEFDLNYLERYALPAF